MSPKILVIGAGINGLASAVCLQLCCPEADIEIVAEKFTPHTTSDGSGGFWEPYALNETDIGLIKHLGKVTYDFLMDLIHSPSAGEIGVQLLSGYTLNKEEIEENPFFKDIVDGYRSLTAEELEKFPRAKSGYFHTTIQMDATSCLQWLTKRFKERGGKMYMAKLSSLNEVAGKYDLVVNCSGLGAKELLNDDHVVPTRGQIWRVHAPWIKHFYILKSNTGSDISYILPGVNSVVVGGTSQVGDWRTEIDEQNSQNIWKEAQSFVPSLVRATPIKAWAGLRPTRTTLRIESEVLDIGKHKLKVVHNYGHGGSGITLFWGCALLVAELAMKTLGRPDVNVQQVLKARL